MVRGDGTGVAAQRTWRLHFCASSFGDNWFALERLFIQTISFLARIVYALLKSESEELVRTFERVGRAAAHAHREARAGTRWPRLAGRQTDKTEGDSGGRVDAGVRSGIRRAKEAADLAVNRGRFC